MKPLRVKICCIASVEEAQLAIHHGAAAVGLVSAMPSGPGPIDEGLIAEIAAEVPPGISTFLLTSKVKSREIAAQHRRCGTTTVQLVDRLPSGAYARLRHALRGVELVQVIHVLDEASLAQAREVAQYVDALLLDSGNPSLRVKQLGGTGRTHDWTLSRRIVETSRVPVYLAGGLRPDNVAQAIAAVRPSAVDVCSGVRTDGELDEEKLIAFMAAVRG